MYETFQRWSVNLGLHEPPQGVYIGTEDWWLTRSEYLQLCKAVSIGFVVMGFIGYLVKLIHIPM